MVYDFELLAAAGVALTVGFVVGLTVGFTVGLVVGLTVARMVGSEEGLVEGFIAGADVADRTALVEAVGVTLCMRGAISLVEEVQLARNRTDKRTAKSFFI